MEQSAKYARRRFSAQEHTQVTGLHYPFVYFPKFVEISRLMSGLYRWQRRVGLISGVFAAHKIFVTTPFTFLNTHCIIYAPIYRWRDMPHGTLMARFLSALRFIFFFFLAI